MSDETTTIVAAVRAALDEALAAGRRSTEQGKAIDDHQVHAERLAYAATEAAAAEALAAYAAARRDAGGADPVVDRMAAAFAGEIAARHRALIEAHREDFGVSDATFARTLASPAVAAAVRAAQHESRFREIGREVIRTRGANNSWIDGDMAEMARDSARGFARKEVAPLAERIHRHDDLVPDAIIAKMRSSATSACPYRRSTAGRGWGTW